MAEIIQEPVTEQTSNSNESEASVDENNETPVMLSKSKTEEKEDIQNKPIKNKEIDYLSLDLFSGVKQISIDELIDDKEEDEVPEDEEKRYKSTLVNFNEKEIITGRIIGINEKDVLIDIGFKSEGIIDRNEFSENNIPEVGEKIEVFLEKIEDESGKTILSKEKADFLTRWKELREIFENETIIKGKILRRIKGGMVVDLNGVQAFLPGSQIDVRPVKDFDQFIDKEMDLKVVKFNEFRKNVVVSHKAIIEESLAEQRDELFNKLEVGSVVDGRVKNITDFGVFIDLGGIDGLLHVTDMTYGRPSDPSKMVTVE